VKRFSIAILVVLGTFLVTGCDTDGAQYQDLKPIKEQLKQIEKKVDQCVSRTG
jgi:hypothetical protein